MKESASGHQPVDVEARLRLTSLEPQMISFAFALIYQDIQRRTLEFVLYGTLFFYPEKLLRDAMEPVVCAPSP